MDSRLLAAIVLAVVTAGCRKSGGNSSAAAAKAGGMGIQVVAVPALKRPVNESVSLVGTVVPNEMIEVKAETDGTVGEIRFKEGERVAQGDLLVALDDTKAAAQLKEAESRLTLARTSFARVEQLYKDRLIAQSEYDAASAESAEKAAIVDVKRRELRDTRVIAPFAGITGARLVSPGQVISKNTRLTWLVDLDTVKVEVEVPERYLSQLKVGQPVEFRVAAFPKDSFKGEIYFISPQLDPGNRTALVKARIPNGDAKLRGGMFASLDLGLQLRDAALVIPEPAIINNGDATFVFVVTPTNTAALKPVKIGLRLSGSVEVLDGMVEGERVVVEGIQKLRPGVPVTTGDPAAAAPYLEARP
ncbi:MAG: efflux RND transporter periplasmic adaptor subunit [Verrucomicrobiales bacterium]|nr:efflux RND transporter periplasmic adaptor subunit [Verrucomicrobiales bacterium]